MKKITFFITLFLTVNFAFSQVLFEDDFDGSGPGLAGWTLTDADGLIPDPNVPQFTSAWIEADDFDNPGDVVAMSTSWYSPVGAADDWMVTPAINLTIDTFLTWDEEAQDANYPDGYEVLISSTSNAVPGDFAVIYSTVAASGGVWATQSVDLSPNTGQTVYLAWRNIANNQFVLMINNVRVGSLAAPTYDAAVTLAPSSTDAQQYTQIPLEQTAAIGTGALIENVGATAVTNASLTVNVYDSTLAVVYTATSATFPLIGVTGSQYAGFAGYTPASIDDYSVEYVVAIAETDNNPADNTISTPVSITANTYARDNGNVIGGLGVGAGTSGQLGQQFDILVVEDILSVTFQLLNGADELTGTTTFASVWDMVGGVPNAIIAQTDAVTILTGDNTYTANITGGPFTLNPGIYAITIEEGAFAITLAYTDAIHTPVTTWINWPTIPSGTWDNNETFGFLNPYVLRPNFQDDTLGLESNSLNSINIGLYPNPASSSVTIGNAGQLDLSQATIYDIMGRVINTYDLTHMGLEKTIDVSTLSPANYFVTIKGAEGEVTKQLIIK